jgi:hypothetical protein
MIDRALPTASAVVAGFNMRAACIAELQSYGVEEISLGLFVVISIVPLCVFGLVLLSAMFRATYGREMMLYHLIDQDP